ncbi:MAG: IS4 family transposase [Nitrospirae bacterium]|nr:IS4 family transposase [Nitrospirota bacterium]
MDVTLLDPLEWAVMQFSDAHLGDVRRSKRLVRVAAALAARPTGTLPRAFPDAAGLKGGYRLLSGSEVTHEDIVEPPTRKTHQLCQQPGTYLLIEDTTQLDFTSRRATRGLGRIGDDRGRGLYVHTTLAVRVQDGQEPLSPAVTLVGLFGQSCWARTDPPREDRQDKARRLRRPRESQRWAKALKVAGRPGAGVEWIYVADRESDIYEVFEVCRAQGVNFVVRASWPRALESHEGSVRDAVAAAPVRGGFELTLRARPGQSARRACLDLRACEVEIRGPWRPDRRCDPMGLNVVEVREAGAPPGVEPIHWVLLTSRPIETLDQVHRVVGFYSRRWWVEEYHKALKTGTRVEASQLSQADRVEALVGILAVVAVRLLNTKLLASATPQEPVGPEEMEPQALKILETRYGVPAGGWTRASVLIAVARMGGFLARKGDGSPGWITIWRGWSQLAPMTEGYILAEEVHGIKCG